jgi:hypothetical protein
MNIDNIFPLVVPMRFYSQNTKKMPMYKLANKDYILTWVVLEKGEPMEYVTPYLHKTLGRRMPGWETLTFENLRLSINENEISFTQHKMSSDGKRIIFIVFLNADGMGSSRVLLQYELGIAFPNGYYIAMPDKTCGLVIAKDITKKELEETTKMVEKTFKTAEMPISGSLHEIQDFALPREWTTPEDDDFSNEMVEEIMNLRGK